MKPETIKLTKTLCKNLFLIAQILLISVALVPPPAFAARTATISVVPSSGVMTYPTYTININISAVTGLSMVEFKLSFNDGVDFLDVSREGVELGDLFAGRGPLLSTGIYHLSDTGLSYLEVLIEMPGNETVTSSVNKSLANITFKLLPDAMPGMISWLKLEWASAWFLTEYIDSKTGITLQSGTVTLGYLVTTLTVNPATATVEKPVTLSSTIKDGGGNPIGGLNISYYIDSLKIGWALTDDYGVSSISYTPDNVGTFTINATYVGNLPGGKYASSSDTDILTVNRRSTTLSLSVQSSIRVGDIVTLAATLTKDTIPMSNETIKFYVNSTLKDSATTNANGIASIQYTFNVTGTYEIKVEYSGTTKYAPSSDTTNRTVAMTRTSLELTHDLIVTKVDSSVTISATLRDEENNLLKDKLIDYYVNSLYVDSDFTDTNGFSSITYTSTVASPPEGWKVEAKFSGSLQFSSSVDTGTIVVNKLKTTLTLSVAQTTITVEQTIIMTATLEDENGQTIPDQNINYFIKVGTQWTKIGNETTDENGIASLDYLPTTTGTLLAKANYPGSPRYSANTSDIIEITVSKLSTSLTLSFLTPVKVEQTVMISATLKDGNQKAISDVWIKYYLLTGALEESIGSAKTGDNGVASIPYTTTEAGTFQIRATFSESTKYLASSDSKVLTVNPIATTLTLDQPTPARVGDTVALVATLEDEDAQPITNSSVYYEIFDSEAGIWTGIGSATTNTLGKTLLNFQPTEAGTFRLRVVYVGDPKYAKSTSEEVNLEVTGEGKESPFGFLLDNKLTVLDILFWGAIMLTFATLVVAFIRRKIKSSEMQTSPNVSPKRVATIKPRKCF